MISMIGSRFDDDYSLLREGEEEQGDRLPQAGHLQERPPRHPGQVCQMWHHIVQDNEVDLVFSIRQNPVRGSGPEWVPDPAESRDCFASLKRTSSDVSSIP